LGSGVGVGGAAEEEGLAEWEDRKDKKVIIPKMIDDQTIHHHASRNMKHRSIITCIIAREEFLTPYIVTFQDSEPLRKRVMCDKGHMRIDSILW
jgi:hypothetical protein